MKKLFLQWWLKCTGRIDIFLMDAIIGAGTGYPFGLLCRYLSFCTLIVLVILLYILQFSGFLLPHWYFQTYVVFPFLMRMWSLFPIALWFTYSDVYVKCVSTSAPFAHASPEKNRLILIILQCEPFPYFDY